VPIDAIVGVSAGAVIAAYYAAVGLDVDDLIADAGGFRGRHLLTYSLNVHLDYRFERRLARWCGVIPDRLRQLEMASFDRLHHGVQRLGIACHDLAAGQPCYFWTGSDHGADLHTVVRASASIPRLFPAVPLDCRVGRYRLTDGGISDPVPLAFSRRPPIAATHIIVSDCRWIGSTPSTDERTVWIRPRMASTGTLWSPRRGLLAAVDEGEAAVTRDVLARIERWLD
jgi:NTE family protein